MMTRVTPRYPRRAYRRNVSAVVELSLSIDDEGEVQMTEVLSVTAKRYERDFIKAAERAAMRTQPCLWMTQSAPSAVTGHAPRRDKHNIIRGRMR